MKNIMVPSANCAAITKEFEGCKLATYICPAGKLTIGYGHTGPDVTEGMTITQEQADDLLMKDLTVAAKPINLFVSQELTQNQFDALCDFVYNCGSGNFLHSTLLKCVNRADWPGAILEFGKWTKAAGKELPGLVKRRAAEAALFARE